MTSKHVWRAFLGVDVIPESRLQNCKCMATGVERGREERDSGAVVEDIYPC